MQPLHPETTARRPVWMWAGAAAGLGLAVTMFLNNSGPRTPAAASRPTATGTFVVTGAVVLGDGASFTRDDHLGCAGTGGYADVRDGAPVLIATASGFAAGKLTDPRALTDGTCRFFFTVRGVPAGQDTYLLMVADQESHQYVEQEFKAWLVSLRVD